MSESTTVTSGLDVHAASVCRWRRMAARGKPRQTIVVACARELAGFVWAIASDQPLRAEG